jgi:hypothetical protein
VSDPATTEDTPTVAPEAPVAAKPEAPKRTKRVIPPAPIDTLDEFAGEPPATLSGAVQVNY